MLCKFCIFFSTKTSENMKFSRYFLPFSFFHSSIFFLFFEYILIFCIASFFFFLLSHFLYFIYNPSSFFIHLCFSCYSFPFPLIYSFSFFHHFIFIPPPSFLPLITLPLHLLESCMKRDFLASWKAAVNISWA